MPTYATAADVKKYSQCKELIRKTDPQINAVLEMAEMAIDGHAGFWTKYDRTQSRTFPRTQDVNAAGATFIPEAIKFATIAQAEFQIINTPDADHGVEEDEKPTVEVISPRAKQYMKKGYICRVGRINYSETQDPAYVGTVR